MIFIMIRQRKKTRLHSNLVKHDFGNYSEADLSDDSIKKPVIDYSIVDYIKFAFFCMLLIVPVYAIAKSAIKHDWLMMMIDALLVPVGFVHGVLLFFGYVD